MQLSKYRQVVFCLAQHKGGIKNRAVWRVFYTVRIKTSQEGLVVSDGRIVRIGGHVTYGIGLVNA